MLITDEIQVSFNTTMASPQENLRPSSTLKPRSGQLRSNLIASGGVGPIRTTRPRASVLVSAEIGTKYETVMKGFKILQSTCKGLEEELVHSEEKVRLGEQVYAALDEKFRSNEASHAELVSKLEDQVRSCDVVYNELVSRTEEKIKSDAAAFADLVLKMEEKVCANEATWLALVSQLEERVQASEAANSELVKKVEETECALEEQKSELSSLRKTIQESVLCGVCQGIPTQPCSTDCRHIFCVLCLLTWWETKQKAVCPVCRKVSKSPPVRDPVQGFVELARTHAGEEQASDSFDADIFDDFFPYKKR